MTIEPQDIRAAVSANILSEAQAASLLALSQERLGYRNATTANEEPFELFKGFNEVFIVVGLTILYSGWMAITGIDIMTSSVFGSSKGVILSFIGLAGVAGCAMYFTLRRRMIAPSIVLTIMAGLSAWQFAAILTPMLSIYGAAGATFTYGLTTVIMLAWYLAFRIPFAVALIGIGVFVTLLSVFSANGIRLSEFEDLFLLTKDGTLAWLTVAMGLVGFAIAMMFDMSDPHRISRRSGSGFWLHVVSAPAIINTIALTLFEVDTGAAYATLIAVLAGLALVAVIIDRRSFLVAGVGYVVALAVTLADGSAIGWSILIMGAALVLLGAQWERLRGAIMRALPAFPGKTRLPPYGV